MSEKLSEPWYKEGLHFKCTGCGKCCTGSPGYVWINEDEIANISEYLNITREEFLKKYVRRCHGRLALVEMKKNYDCVFLKDNRCQIYPVRPTQCKTFPYWPQNLHSQEAWEETAKECEGISSCNPKVSIETIEEQKLIQIRRNHHTK